MTLPRRRWLLVPLVLVAVMVGLWAWALTRPTVAEGKARLAKRGMGFPEFEPLLRPDRGDANCREVAESISGGYAGVLTGFYFVYEDGSDLRLKLGEQGEVTEITTKRLSFSEWCWRLWLQIRG